jgi:hypothetical protein
MSEYKYKLALLRECNEAMAALMDKGYIESDGDVAYSLTCAGQLAGQFKFAELSPEDRILIMLYVMTMELDFYRTDK